MRIKIIRTIQSYNPTIRSIDDSSDKIGVSISCDTTKVPCNIFIDSLAMLHMHASYAQRITECLESSPCTKQPKTPQETSPYAAQSLSQTLRPQSLKPKGRSEMKRKASNRSQSHNRRPHFIGSRVERPRRVELLAQPEIRVVQDPVLGSGPVVPGVLAEVLELLQRATTQHLPQQ